MKIVHSNDIADLAVSHDELIMKKVFISKGEIPNLMQFGASTLKPGQSIENHLHKTMYEVFYVQSGKVEFVVDDRKVLVEKGDCITIEQGELHAMNNPFYEDVNFIYFGIATD